LKIFDIDNQKLLGETDDPWIISWLNIIFGDDYIDANGNLCIEERAIFIFEDFARIFKTKFNFLVLNDDRYQLVQHLSGDVNIDLEDR
jgi:hypothetical protein